jgi:preprotein translocase subunit SecF
VDGVDLTLSVVDLLKFEGLFTRSFRDKDKYYVLPDNPFFVREAIRNYRVFEANQLVDRFVSEDFSRINVVCRTHCASTSEFIEAEKMIRAFLDEHFSGDLEFDVTGVCVVGSHSAHALTAGQIKSLGIALICIFVILSSLFLSARVGLLAMIPNFFPILVNFGAMGWLGIHLNVATSLVASIAIGLAVDDSIHYMFRFKHHFTQDFSRKHANHRTITDVGKPIIFTSLAIGLGFSVLLFSSFVPTSVFGLLMVITMTSALLGDLFILPVIMQSTPWLLVVMERGIGSYRRISLFRNLSFSEKRRVVLTGSREHYLPGDVIFRSGEVEHGMYLILQGKVRLDLHLGETPEDGSVEIGQGGVFGEIGIGRPTTRTTTAMALDNSLLLHVDEKMFNHLEQHWPRLAFTLYLNLMAIMDERMKGALGLR